MKLLKKLFAVIFALTLTFGMGTKVNAGTDPANDGPVSEETTQKKSISLEGGKQGHTYTLYQIFTGKVETVEGVEQLTNIQWGTDAPATFKSAFDTAAAAAKSLETQDDARLFAQSYTFTGGIENTLTADGKVEFKNLDEGYYVIVDTVKPGATIKEEGDYYSAFVVNVVKDVTGSMKGNKPSSNKKVADNNDTDRVQPELAAIKDTEWHDSADYDIGDAVPFKLTATTASNTNAYKKYHITFQDNYSEGLDAPTTWLINALETDIPFTGTKVENVSKSGKTKITVESGTTDENQKFAIKVTFTPVSTSQEGEPEVPQYLDDECISKDITVKYTQRLNDKAKIGAEGNPNTSYIKYSSNPESSDDHEEGKTPEDKVIVFTYKTTVDKVDETGVALKGADFALYKQVPQATEGAQKGSEIKANFSADLKTAAAALADNNYYVVAGQKGTVTADTTQFSFKGIDDGTYVLVETAVPTGYNAWTAKEFTVTATHTDDTAEAVAALTKLEATAPFAGEGWAGSIEITKKNKTKYMTDSGELYAEIENKSGTTLPSTGGIGTTIFYVLGGLLVVGAGIVLVARKNAAE